MYKVTTFGEEKNNKKDKEIDFITHGKKRNSVTVPAAEKASINSSSVVLSL